MALSAQGLAFFAFLQLLVLTQAKYAYNDHMFFPSQMVKKGFKKGLPLVAHLGIWGDFVYLSYLLALIWDKYHSQWAGRGMCISLAVGIALSALMHWSYTKIEIPEAHTYFGRLMPTGYIHSIYMAIGIAELVQLYFRTSGVDRTFIVWLVSVPLGIHIVLGTHCVLGILKELGRAPSWFASRPLRNPATWATIGGTWLLLFVGSIVALGKP